MSRALLILTDQTAKARAQAWINQAPWNTRVTFQSPRRSVDQNSALWAALTDIATQLTWHGQRYTADDWKDYLMHALRKARWMPDEDGGFVPIGMRSSELSREEFGDLLDLTFAFGARHGVEFAKDRTAPALADGTIIEGELIEAATEGGEAQQASPVAS